MRGIITGDYERSRFFTAFYLNNGKVRGEGLEGHPEHAVILARGEMACLGYLGIFRPKFGLGAGGDG